MSRWLQSLSKNRKGENSFISVADSLRRLYKTKLLPLEELYRFKDFHSPPMEDADFDARPMILLVGQYSTGKTTFIKHLLESSFPGMLIGPEPTTDKFIILMHGEKESITPGNALVHDSTKNFRSLQNFGNCFLNRLQLSTCKSPVLESITIVDTPGVLSGEKQRVDRGYDFSGVLEWFAERVDRIILLFDAYKLDISDEFRRSIEALRGHDEKIRIVLNKADMVDAQQLMRIYGALMWSLGKVLNTPEVSRVYIGSFWDKPLRFDTNRRLFEAEQQDLFSDLQSLPRNAVLRKLNDLIKRTQEAKVHALIIGYLKKEMPSFIGREAKKNRLIKSLDDIYVQIESEHQIPPSDFPNSKEMQEKLLKFDWKNMSSLNMKMIETVDKMMDTDIANIMSRIPMEQKGNEQIVEGGVFDDVRDSPFSFGRGEGFDKGAFDSVWVVHEKKKEYDQIFESLNPVDGKLTGAVVRQHLMKSKLNLQNLRRIWTLADIDRDGLLDSDEFALAMYLIHLVEQGYEIPNKLPAHLIPPSKIKVDQ